METKRFQKNDSGFICQNCKRTVLPLGQSSRDHCPFCLCSLHLDVLPGDRAANCGGIMDAVKSEPDPKKGFILYYVCRKCGEKRRCKAAYGVKIQPDDLSKLIALTAGQN